ncbi:MAG: glycosyltransferase family 2 protein [Marinoscillum sp.]
MNQEPLVSIIMAAKDTAPYLPDCLDSILAQTYENWELIAVNDHSEDTTADILEAYAEEDDRIRVVHAKRHRLIPALQEGYAVAEGELINRMDSDDLMPDDKLEALVGEWLKHGEGTVIAGGTVHFVDDGVVGDGFLKYEQWLNEVARTETHYQEIYKECVIPSHSWLAHRNDFEAAGAFDPVVYPEDYDLCFRFYRNGLNVVGLDKVLHHWRDRSDRISRTWEEYKDNRYFELKLNYFYELDRDPQRPLVLWGAGPNGKDMARLLAQREDQFHWVCNNSKKIGKDIYDIRLHPTDEILNLSSPQIMIVVTTPKARSRIEGILSLWGKEPVKDYWFFL